MIAFAREFLFIVGGGLLFGLACALITLYFVDRWLHRVRATEGRGHEDFFVAKVAHALDEPAGGGAADLPHHRGEGWRVRVLGRGDRLLVTREHGGAETAAFEVRDERLAADLCDLLARQEGEDVPPPFHDPCDRERPAREVLLRWSAGLRRIAVVREGASVRVVELHDGRTVGVAHVACVHHARQIVELLTALRSPRPEPRPAPSAASPAPQPVHAAVPGGSFGIRDEG